MTKELLPCLIMGIIALPNLAVADETDRTAVVLEEVVVTARKRTENLQDVPVSVTSVTSEEMRANNIATIADVARIAPGLDQREGRKQGAFSIRGVGQVRINELQADPGVGVYIDGIFLARNDSQLLDTLTLQSVQVLRGPQGTLFGKNTIGGAILVTTKDPAEEFALNLGTKLDELGQRDVQVSADVPIVDGKVYSKITLGAVRSDGYAEDNDTGKEMGNDDRQVAALQLLWNISDDVSLKTLAYLTRQDDNIPAHYCQQVTLVGAMSFARAPGREDAYNEVCSEAEALIGEEKVDHENVVSGFTSRDALLGATLSWDTSFGTVKSITSYAYKGHSSQDFDFDATDLLLIGNTSYGREQLRKQGIYDEDDSRETVSQELQFTGSAFDERLQYTVGVFGSLESLDNQLAGQLATVEGWVGFEQLPGLPSPNTLCLSSGIAGEDCLYVRGVNTLSVSDYKNTSYALFSQASYDLTSSIQLTAGLRYTYEERELDLEQFGSANVPPVAGVPLPPAIPITLMTETQFNQLEGDVIQLSRGPHQYGSVDFERLSPMASLAWDITDSVQGGAVDSFMIYATVAEGFKSGGFNVLATGIDHFKPEYVISSEIGFKLDALRRRLRLNMALYNSDYNDVQVVVAKIPSIGAPEISTNNAGLAQMRGVEAELTWLLNDAWMINFSGNYIDAEFLEYDDEVLDPVTSSPRAVDRSDEPFPFIPKYVYNIALRYSLPTQAGDFDFMLSRNTRSEQFIGGDATAGLPQFRDDATIDGFSVWTGRATWTPWDDERLRIALYGNNLTDEEYVATGSAVYSGFGTNSLTIGKERHFGLEVNYEYR